MGQVEVVGGGGCHRKVILTVPKSHISKHASDHIQLEAAALLHFPDEQR